MSNRAHALPYPESETLPTAANANATLTLVNTGEKEGQNCAAVAPEQRLRKLVREVFEGHEEYLGLTPD